MKILRINLNEDLAPAIEEAIAVLSSGGVIIYPTDTLYGMGANALDEKAVKKVFAIKRRSFSKPLPIIVRNMAWVKELARINRRQENSLRRIWPGKVTAVLTKRDTVPDILTGGADSVGIRVPDFSLTDLLLARYGYPITSTSANISGNEPSRDINLIIETFSQLDPRPDLILDAGILPPSDPSTIVDFASGSPKILRAGPSKPNELLKLLQISSS